MQRSQTASNSTADKGNRSLGAMVTAAVDAWSMIRYYQQLLEFEQIDSDESIALLTDCYIRLSEPYREELGLILTAIHELVTCKVADTKT